MSIRPGGRPAVRAYSAKVRIAALDLGSNSFHLLVVDAHPDGTFEPLLKEKEMLRLGDVVARTGRLPDESVDAAVASVRRMRALADAAGADEFVACATAALREAENGSEVVDRIEAETGVRVQVISGRDEARLVFGAIRASVLIDPGPAVGLDLGGGSLEVMVGDAGGLLWSTSVKLGVARLTAELVRSDPVTPADLRRLRKRIDEVFSPVAAAVVDLEPHMLVGSSGTLNALVRMAAAHRDGEVPRSVNQVTVHRTDVAAVHERIVGLSAPERQRLPGVDARRADLLPAGSALLMAVFDTLGLDEITGSEWALREGMVLDAIGHHDPVDWLADPRSLRRASVLALCRRCSWDEAHSRQVAHLALELFDQLVAVHRLAPRDRELLEYAALLHDIGEHVSAEGHDKHTAYLIEHGKLRGFDPDEIAVLTCVGRFHRRSNPKASFPVYGGLDPAARDRVDRLTALLRVADGLDRSHSAAVESVAATVQAGAVALTVHAAGEIDGELWGLRRKRELFERVFGRSLEIVELPRPTANDDAPRRLA